MMSGIYGEGLAVMEAEYQETTNGHGTPPPLPSLTKRAMPVRTRRIDFDGDYEGWWAIVRTNAPFGVFLNMISLVSGDVEKDPNSGLRVAQAMAELVTRLPKLVMDWNFVDEEGEPLPCNIDGMKELPKELLLDLVNKLNAGDAVPKG